MNINKIKWCGILSALLCVPAVAQTTISFDANTTTGVINPLIYGANHRFGLAGSGGSDPTTGITYPTLISQIVNTKISMLRFPGGTMANTYHWANAIGPQARRQLQVNGNISNPVPIDSTFGPDEFGNMLNQTGATGNLMLNFATESSKDAAHFVAYMTATQGGAGLVDGVDWAALRASNGQTAPYNISYVEVGNEYNGTTEEYWLTGTPVTSTLNPTCSTYPIRCMYIYGGSTSFTSQPAVQPDDWRASASVSNGTAGQSFYAQYPPVALNSQTVYVNGTAWTPVTSLSSAAPTAQAYTINNTTGQIQFGNGTNGAIPPSGDTVTISYTSGPHDGFQQFYQAVKAVNPNLKVCISMNDPTTISLMGTTVPYDCVQVHPYVGLPSATNIDDFFAQTMHEGLAASNIVTAVQSSIKTYAGSNASNIPVLLSEWGINAGEPTIAPHFQRSLGAAIYDAVALRLWMIDGVNAAERHALIDYTFGAPPIDLGVSNFDNVLIGGPGPTTVETPSALAMQLFATNTGPTRIKNTVTGSPTRTMPDGTAQAALVAVSSLDNRGNAYLIVINQDPETAVTATVEPENFTSGGTATVETLNSTKITDENNQMSPTTVQLASQSASVGTGNFSWTFPAHSVTAIQLMRQ